MTNEDALALISNPEAYSFRSDTTASHIRVAMMMFVCLRNGVVDPKSLADLR